MTRIKAQDRRGKPQPQLSGPWLRSLADSVTERSDPKLSKTFEHFAEKYQSNLGDPDCLYALAMIAKQVERRELAEELFQRALVFAPARIDYIGDLGNLYSDMGRFNKAIACYRRVLEQQPNHALALNNLANTLQEQGDLDQAIACYRQALTQQPDYVDAWTNLGNTLEKNGQLDDAVQAFQRALDIRPDHLQAKINLGIAFHLRGKTEEAVASLQEVLQQNPKAVPAALRLLRIYLEQGRYTEAEPLSENIRRLVPGNQQSWAAEAFCHLARQDEAHFSYLYRPSGLPHQEQLQPPQDYGDMADFNATLANEIQSHPSLKWINDTHETSRRGFVYGLTEAPPPALARFIEQLSQTLDRFKASIQRDSEHPFFGRVPERSSLNLWATLLNSGGWHPPHYHEKNWLSGVYYVATPALSEIGPKDKQGWIEFDGFTHLPGLDHYSNLVQSIEPQPGLLVLFPSYSMHSTRPFEGSGLRISMAFDVKPL